MANAIGPYYVLHKSWSGPKSSDTEKF